MFERLVGVLSPRMPGLDVVACDVRSVMDYVALGRCFLPALLLYTNNIIPLIIHTHFSLISVTAEQVREDQKPLKKRYFFLG
jgi:hypothetical protein